MTDSVVSEVKELPKYSKRNGIIRILAVLFAFFGWWMSLDLVLLGINGHATTPWLEQSCGQTLPDAAPSDCNSVIHSSYGYVLKGTITNQGIPVSVNGMAYFAFVGAWFLFVGPTSKDRRVWQTLLTVVVLIGVCQSLWFIKVMAFDLEQWCQGCLAAHAANGGLLLMVLASWLLTKSDRRSAYPTRSHAMATLCAGGALGLLNFALMLSVVFSGISKKYEKAYIDVALDPAYMQWDYERQQPVDIPASEDDIIMGDPSAPHTLVLFSDFQCKACAKAHDAVDKAMEKYPGRLRVIYKFFPQDPACNAEYAGIGGHEFSCEAARAALAVRATVGDAAFDAFRTQVYASQNHINSENLTKWAQAAGLDADAYAAMLLDERIEEKIQADIALGIQLETKAMPALFLDGKPLKHWRGGFWDHFFTAIEVSSAER